ncbi:MAG: GGDEF domain-containing protein [Ruminococcus sp.]|nr:GGDEF domain-containing protein [Ruminococcus sp.]
MVGSRKVVSLCISRVSDMENFRFINRLSSSLTQNGCCLMVYAINCDLYWSDENMRAETHVFDLIDFDRTDILVIMHEKIKNDTITDTLIARAREKNVPVVIVDGTREGCVRIAFDYRSGFERIVRHVVEEHGMRDVHLIAGIQDNPFSDERIDVFRQVLRENGIPCDDSMISYGGFWAVPARRAAEKVIDSGKIPRCFICANDIMAINIAAFLRDRGFRVPEDIAVTGFDGIDEVFFTTPKITTSLCGASELAEPVFEACMEYFRTGKCAGELLRMPILLTNESCGCPKSSPGSDLSLLANFNDRFYRAQDDGRILTEISERMQACGDMVSAACCLYDDIIHDVTIVINSSCCDPTRNYFEIPPLQPFDDQMIRLFTAGQELNLLPMERTDILPDLSKAVNAGYPLIFTAITFMNVPLGYACFRYRDSELIDYCKIIQIITSIGSGLGGYMNMQYQHYLSSRIEEMYKFDSLTGLYNRLGFSKDYALALKEHEGGVLPLTAVLADIDRLKYINDSFGHSAGDNAIHTVAEALKSACPDSALCLRFGGDEMLAVIIGECSGEEIAAGVTRHLEDYNINSGLGYDVSCSLGLYVTDTASDTDIEHLIRQADVAMYSEKRRKHKLLGFDRRKT